MIKFYAYTSKKKKIKTKEKMKKDITKYLTKINKRKSRLITPIDLAMTEKRKEFKSKDFILPYMLKCEFRELLKNNNKCEFRELLKNNNNPDDSLFSDFYLIEEPVMILHLGSLLENSEINFSNIKLYLDGKKVKLTKRKLDIVSYKMAKHRFPFKKEEISAIKRSLVK